mmetsp:Transcript_8752/g.19225  ORF Transcript_8752/g.19225 Transcript_8752/m.19225 type:complete len:241 (+) Transcript_8752:305-1027(+)
MHRSEVPLRDATGLELTGPFLGVSELQEHGAELFAVTAALGDVARVLATGCEDRNVRGPLAWLSRRSCTGYGPQGNRVQWSVRHHVVEQLPLCAFADVPNPDVLVQRGCGNHLPVAAEVKLLNAGFGVRSLQAFDFRPRVGAPENQLTVLVRAHQEVVSTAPSDLRCGGRQIGHGEQLFYFLGPIEAPDRQGWRMRTKAIMAGNEPLDGGIRIITWGIPSNDGPLHAPHDAGQLHPAELP